MLSHVCLALLGFASLAATQLTGPVGPTTALSTKGTICSVLDYGGTIGSEDIGPALQSAFTNCVVKTPGSTLYLPAGNYSMATWVTFKGGSSWAFRFDGFITRTSDTGGHMFLIQNADDIEVYSANSAGGIQGHGYLARNAGPRFMRFVTCTNFSVHDLIFVDSPEFHLLIVGGSNGEAYNIIIRGANIGGSDGIDVSGTNHWVHDVSVTNADECVTIKDDTDGILVENIWCNYSGGCGMGSYSTNTNVQNVVYNKIYTVGGNQAMMLKSRGGNGTVKNILMENFIFDGPAYGLYINQNWTSMAAVAGDGIALSNFTFKDWYGFNQNGLQRPPIKMLCADKTPCQDMTFENMNVYSYWPYNYYFCESVYGTGLACLAGTEGTDSYVSSVSYASPTGMTVPTSTNLPGDLTAGFDPSSSIPVPTAIPTMYFPGVTQISQLAVYSTASAAAALASSSSPTATSSKQSSTVSSTSVKATFSTVKVSSSTAVAAETLLVSSVVALPASSAPPSSVVLESTSEPVTSFVATTAPAPSSSSVTWGRKHHHVAGHGHRF